MSPRRSILLVAGLAIVALCVPNRPRFIWNATASAPVGLYWVSASRDLAVGDLVLADPPNWVRPLAAKRGYLPLHVPLVKRIAALSGDKICAIENRITLNGRMVAKRQGWDTRHHLLPHWVGCRTLDADEVFLLMVAVPASFDGRYFGPVSRHAVLGKLWPLWTS